MPHTDGTPDRIVHGDTDSNGSASESLASEHDEDSPHQSGDKGIQVLGVRADAAGSLVDTDGDYAPFQVDATGALRVTTAGAGPAASVAIVDTGGDELDVQPDGSIDVNIVSSTGGGLTDAELRATPVPVVTQEPISVDDNGGSLTVDGTVAVTGTQTDALTDAELRATPVPVVTQEPISVDDNGGSLTVDGSVSVSNFPAVQPVSDNGGSLTVDGTVAVTGTQTDALTDAELRASPVPVSGTVSVTEPVSVDDNGGSLTVDGSVAVSNFPATQPVSGTVTADTELPAAAALADNTANPTVPGVGAFGMVYDGSTWDRLPGNSTDGVLVNLGTNNDVTITGTVTTASASGTFNNGAETAVTGSATSILASNSSRKHAIIQNTGLANIRVGISGVTATTGMRLIPGAITSLPVTSAIFAIREGSTSSIALAQEIT